MTSRRLLTAIVLAVLACACSSSTSKSAPPSTSPPGTGPSSRCEPASAELLSAIEQGLTVQGDGSLRNGFVVRSSEFKKVWFVSAEIDGTGIENAGDVGVWSTNDLTGAGLILSVNGFATQFSDWIDASTTDARQSMEDDGASEVAACS